LVNNAIKFTDAGEVTVEISVSAENEIQDKTQLDILVKDTGKGISENDLQHIFKPFWQVPSADKSGTGLGLTTANKLLNLLEGEIKIDSKIGEGTSVRLNIPVQLNKKTTSSDEKPSAQKIDKQSVKGLRALIVDDLPLNRTLARIMLEMKEFETIEAENGKEAVDYFNDTKPDVVLMDISMPVMDGIEAMEKIRMIIEKNGQDIPIIAITAGGHAGSRNDLIQKGFSEYIQKPYREKELFEKISLFLPVQATNGTKPSLKHSSIRV
jgi:CheY-like chemotaxis protein